MSFLCTWFGIFCPKTPDPPAPPSDRQISIDVSGATEFVATLVPDLFPPIVGERMVPEAPWHITFVVPGSVGGGANIQIVAEGWMDSVTRLSVGSKTVDELGGIPATDTQCDPVQLLPATPAVHPRRGVPQLTGRVFSDADGPYLALGTSLFWAPWAWNNDREKLNANLAYAKGRVDYIRVLLAVGPGGLWDQRLSTMQSVVANDTLRHLANHAYDNYGIRLMPTIFGTVQGTQLERDDFVDYVARTCQELGEKIHHIEVANEGDNNGFVREKLIEYVARIKRLYTGVVALTAPVSQSPTDYYKDSGANLMTLHLERDVNGTGGVWRPVRQAREGQATGWAWSSNEPIGIGSSVAQDDDPLRLTMSAALTWLCTGATYVTHTGAGIYGIEYQASTAYRRADLWEQPTLSATLDGIATLRRLLPADLPNWHWLNGNANFPDYPFQTDPLVKEDSVLRSFLSTDGTNFVCMPIRVAQDTPYIARRPMQFTHYDPLTGEMLGQAQLQPGESYVLTGAPNGQKAAIFIGRYL